MKNLYEILSVSETADEATIKAAYRKLAKELHPDVTGNDPTKAEQFKEVNQAYSVLGEPEKRAAYDMQRRNPFAGHSPFPQQQAGQGFPFPGFRVNVQRGTGVDPMDAMMEDFLRNMFGQHARGTRAAPRAGSSSRTGDVTQQIDLTFVEAALGTTKKIRTPSGKDIEISIPSGISSGSKLMVEGGGDNLMGSRRGNLYLDIRVKKDKRFQKRPHGQYDVETNVNVSVADVALGSNILVPGLEGDLKVTVPPGTESGSSLRVRGHGIRRMDGSRGDHYYNVKIIVPDATKDPEMKKLFQKLKDIHKVEA